MDTSMSRGPSRNFVALILGIFVALGLLSGLLVSRRAQIERHERTARAYAMLPARMLWVWERPEDLRSVDPSTVGVAVLMETIYLGVGQRRTGIAVQPRMQSLQLPNGIARVDVVRMETVDGYHLEASQSALLAATASQLVRNARTPGIAALQIDFDAKKSERGFYRALLQHVRAEMPPTLPLTITALASWCSTDDWIAQLPVDQAVPMFFRMEPDRRRMMATEAKYRVTEPLCMANIGVSTHEPWPPDIAGKRVYIFSDKGWESDLAVLRGLPNVRQQTNSEVGR